MPHKYKEGDAIIPFSHKNLNVNLNLKSMCNLRCDYCSIPEVSKSTNVQDKTILRNMDILISKMLAEGYTWDFCMLIGAEPLMASPETVASVFNKVKIAFPECRLKIQSNGTLFTDDYAGRLQEAMTHPEEMTMGWSLDGVRDIQNEWRDNSYDLAVHNLFLTNSKYIFPHQIIMSLGPQHFEPKYEAELLEFTMKCLDEGIHPTYSIVDYNINENAIAKQPEIIRIDNIKVWKPFSEYLIKNELIPLCEKYFNTVYCRREGNECSRVLFDLADGGVYQCEKTFDIHAATINNFVDSSITDCMLSRRGCTQNCKIDEDCLKCEFWDYCQGSCSLKRTDGLAHACELTKVILGHIKNDLNLDYWDYLNFGTKHFRDLVKVNKDKLNQQNNIVVRKD